ncbi:MAG: MarR family winged helix-turn-helix transcriptional regulator [Mycobacterium sp.]
MRALTAESDQIGRTFARQHDLSAGDFRALLHIMVAAEAGYPLAAGQLRERMGLSGAAITYLVERLIASGHVRRISDPGDRRKVLLRNSQHGVDVAAEFFVPAAAHSRGALAGLSDDDLVVGHRVMLALLEGLQRFGADLDAYGTAAASDASPG